MLTELLLSSTKCSISPVVGSNWEVGATTKGGEVEGIEVELCPIEGATAPTLAYKK